MNGHALDRVFRSASGQIIGALAARFRNLDMAEDGFAEACARAIRVWAEGTVPSDPAAWLYRTAERVVLDELRRARARRASVGPGSIGAECGSDADR